VDSLLRVADPTTPAYGDALYWHGALAQTAAEAERDYRRVIVEYPLAYYADDALLAIAELEQARGDRAAALLHLQRFVKEHPSSPARGTAALNAARLAFEQRDATLGCSMIAAARTSVAATDIELRNQVDYYGRQCPRSAVATTPPATVATTPTPVSTMPEPVTPAPRPATTSAATVASSSAAPTPARRPAPIRSDTVPTRSTPAPTAAAPAAPSPGVARGSVMYTIQVAAYDTRPAAEQLVRTLTARNVKARVSGTSKPFRVRLDFYRTHKEAVDAAAALKARGIVGFVTEEVPPVRPTTP
jgi:cell division protein FtsN